VTLDACIAEIRQLAAETGGSVRFMEVCGTHTMSAFRTGLHSLLPAGVSLLSGPGCPVCVTPNGYLDRAVAIAGQAGTTVATFGDMLRVPGTESSLERARALGADVRIVYSPLDALGLAKSDPHRRVVFLGVGFETTTPTVAWTIREARETGTTNYSVLCAHKTIPEAMDALFEGGDVLVAGFMCPGHVSVIIGSGAYEEVCGKRHVPCVVAGFEAADMAEAIRMLLRQVSEDRADVEVQYTRSVTRDGNEEAQAVCDEVFARADTEWRGVGVIPASGLDIREEYAAHDAARLFGDLEVPEPVDDPGCRCGEILRGVIRPDDCPLFGRRCTPASPVGACMVSSEGTCAAHYRYRR